MDFYPGVHFVSETGIQQNLLFIFVIWLCVENLVSSTSVHNSMSIESAE